MRNFTKRKSLDHPGTEFLLRSTNLPEVASFEKRKERKKERKEGNRSIPESTGRGRVQSQAMIVDDG